MCIRDRALTELRNALDEDERGVLVRLRNAAFGNLRTGIDVFLVIAATSLSCLLLGSIEGVREGTLVAAVCGGQFAKVFLKVLGRLFPAHRPVD